MNPVNDSPTLSPPLPLPVPGAAAPTAGVGRGFGKPLLIAVVSVAVLAWLTHFGLHAYHFVETDNAYVTGHLLQISPQVDGQVLDVLVDDNQTVKAGDVLVRLDPVTANIAAQKAAASLAQARAQQAAGTAAAIQAEAQLAESSARVNQAEAEAGQARAQLDLARLTAARNDQLLKNGGAVTQADVDASRSALHSAQAAVDAAGANLVAAQAAVGSAQAARQAAAAQATAATANVAAAEASLQDAHHQLTYMTLTAPADGRVGDKNVEIGNRVLAGQILLELAEPAPWIVANFKETQLPLMKDGQPVDITIDALPGQVLHGQVQSLSPASGAQFALLPPDNATGNFNKIVQRIPVKIVLDPESLARVGGRLRLGFSAIVDVRVR